MAGDPVQVYRRICRSTNSGVYRNGIFKGFTRHDVRGP